MELIKTFTLKIFNFVKRYFLKKKEISWGRRGEDLAGKFLRKKGYRILARNFVNKKGYRVGEIDIVAEKEDEIIFVEVKTRKKRGRFDMPPEMAVDRRKLMHLQKSANRYLQETGKMKMKYRFEIVGITYDERGEMEIRHVEQVFL